MTTEATPEPRCSDATGPWPFVTRRVLQLADRERRIWSSRHHRKGLALPAADAIGLLAALEAVARATGRCLPGE